MVHLKSEKELEYMIEGGKRLRNVVSKLRPWLKPGVQTSVLDQEAERFIIEEGGESSFKKVSGYKWSTCLPINEQVVHTPPSARVLRDGDVLTLDIGMYYKGFHTDYADTVIIGKSENKETEHFLNTGKLALKKALAMVKKENYIGQISQVIEKEVTGEGFCILKDLTGHGVGHELHEDPSIPGFLSEPIKLTYKIRPGLAIAVEVIYSKSTEKIAYETQNGWSIRTKDRSLSACFEHTVVVNENGSVVVT